MLLRAQEVVDPLSFVEPARVRPSDVGQRLFVRAIASAQHSYGVAMLVAPVFVVRGTRHGGQNTCTRTRPYQGTTLIMRRSPSAARTSLTERDVGCVTCMDSPDKPTAKFLTTSTKTNQSNVLP